MRERTKRTEMLLGAEAMERLRAAHVIVFGLGGVGSWCAEALARSGVGRLTLVDEDSVAESNLNRQVCALGSTIGRPKAEVMAARLRDIAPDAEIIPVTARYEAASRGRFFPGDYAYVADCIDLVSCKLDLIEAALEGGTPIISALGTGNKLDASRFEVCDIAETRGCPLARVTSGWCTARRRPWSPPSPTRRRRGAAACPAPRSGCRPRRGCSWRRP